MIRLTKKLENKYFIDSLKEEKILTCEDGYRLVTIKVFDCLETEGVKLSELLIELYSEEFNMYLYDYSFYSDDDRFFEFQICIDEEYLKEFNTLYNQFKKSVNDLLEVEEEEEILKAEEEEEIIETEKEEVKENQTFLESEIEFWNDEVEEDKKETSKYKIGQYLYNCGDMANDSGWYRVVNVTIDKFGIFYNVEEVGGNRKNTYPEYCISEVDRLNGSTRIVTKEARIKATNKTYVKNQLTALILKEKNEKDHEEKIKETEEVNKKWYQITDHEEEEKKEIINDLVETCWNGIKIEKEIRIYFNRLAKDQRTKVLNKFQREKKGLDINLFYYNTFLNEEFYLSELQEIRSKIVKYIDFLNNFRNSVIEEVNNYQEQIKNFKKEKEPFYNNTFKILKDEDFKIVKLDSDTKFGNGNLCYIDEYTLYHKDLGYASMNGQTPYIPEGGRCALKAMIDEKIIDSIPHWIESAKFKYTYRSRGYSIGCQPSEGLINSKNEDGYKFEVITYNRKLTCREISDFELIDLNK